MEGALMYERLLSETEQYLERSKDGIVRLKALWKFITDEGKRNNFDVPSLTDFSCLLDGDKRFEFVTLNRGAVRERDREDDLLEHEELGKLGFGKEQYVRLRKLRLDDDEDMGDEEEEKFIPFDDDIAIEENQEEFEDLFFPSSKRNSERRSGKRQNTALRAKSSKSLPHTNTRGLASAKRKIAVKKTSHKKRKK